ncbi:MAG: PEP-CTERM sorting domain-containing protein, partial [Massilia sp.]
LTNNQNIEGGVFVKELHQNGELHLQPFSGNVDFAVERSFAAAAAAVPEPASIALVLAGLLMLGMGRRQSRPQGMPAVAV